MHIKAKRKCSQRISWRVSSQAKTAVTYFLRTFYNFRWTYGKDNKTPAQSLGITEKAYDIKDIIYFR